MNQEIDDMEDNRPQSFIGDAELEDMNHMINLLAKFENINRVLENAALTAALMNYIFNKSLDFHSLLFYFAIKKYLRINETKNHMRNYNHLNMEIFTVFIHPKSILPVTYKNAELLAKIEEYINSPDCIVYYHKLSKCIVTEVLTEHLDQFREHIKSGEDRFCYANRIHSDISKENELQILEVLQKSIQNSLIRSQKSRCLPSNQQDIKNLQSMFDFQIAALTKAIHTQFEQFIFNKRYSLMTSLPLIVMPTNTFLSSSTVKLPFKQRAKGHCFEADSLSTVSFCLVCDVILWGTHPSCLHCRNCKRAIHFDCKDMVKNCQLESKRSKNSDSSATTTDRAKEIGGQKLLDNMTQGLTKIIDDTLIENEVIVSPEIGNLSIEPISEDPPIGIVQELKKQFSPSPFGNKKPKIAVKYTSSMRDSRKNDFDIIIRSKSARSPSPNGFFREDMSKMHSKFPSKDSGIAASVEPLPTSQDESDDEMCVTETFQPEIELRRFSKVLKNKGHSHHADDHRLLVLLEFHHNIKFIRMTLKRFLYVLVHPWLRMNEHLHLFDLLSLDCIEKLYKLIGSLVAVIDSCENESTYDWSIAENVLKWLTSDEEANLVAWLQLSSNLCCTNILNSVKAIWMENKQMYPKLNELFSCEVNRIVIVNQLSNMRPLLFNLPMIITKIIKDLKKFTLFKDEVSKWKEIHEKISRLPKIIDERCMPVVHFINSGMIGTSHLKYKHKKDRHAFNQDMKFYIDNFPNSIFKNNFIDLQFVKISNLSQSPPINSKILMSSIFIKDDTDAAVICYDKELILLQKENEKYFLKNLKSLGTENRKILPVVGFENIHLTKQSNKNSKEFRHQLSILVIDEVILIQINFRNESIRDMWFNMITKASLKIKNEKHRNPSSVPQSDSDTVDGNIKTKCIECMPSKTEIIRNQLNQSVNHLMSTFDLISNELSTVAVPGHTPKNLRKRSPPSSNEFLVGYIDILREYTLVAEELISQSKFKDSIFTVSHADITQRTTKLKDITKEMGSLIKSFEQTTDGSESSSDYTLKDYNSDHSQKEKQSVESFLEDVLTTAMNKIQCNQKSESPKK